MVGRPDARAQRARYRATEGCRHRLVVRGVAKTRGSRARPPAAVAPGPPSRGSSCARNDRAPPRVRPTASSDTAARPERPRQGPYERLTLPVERVRPLRDRDRLPREGLGLRVAAARGVDERLRLPPGDLRRGVLLRSELASQLREPPPPRRGVRARRARARAAVRRATGCFAVPSPRAGRRSDVGSRRQPRGRRRGCRPPRPSARPRSLDTPAAAGSPRARARAPRRGDRASPRGSRASAGRRGTGSAGGRRRRGATLRRPAVGP